MMADELIIIKETIRRVLRDDLRKRRISCRLTHAQKPQILASCHDFIRTYQDNHSFLDWILPFPKVKTALKIIALKRKRFQDAENIKNHVTAELKAVPLKAFADSFENFLNDSTTCIQVGGSYFEKKRKNFLFLCMFFCFFFQTSPETLLPVHVIIKSALKRLGKR
jgi:hypothetical protein